MAAQTLKAVYYRGGTSKALFLLEDDIPPAGPRRDALIKRLVGSPDPLQIDGMGGSRVVTSKVAIIKKSTGDYADVDYTFAQVAVGQDVVGYEGNCGNISSAVGPFSIASKLLDVPRPGQAVPGHPETQEVRIFNTGTRKVIKAHVPVDSSGNVVETGDFSVPGVPGTGAPILLDYVETVGATLNRGILPTGNITDTITINDKPISITICDVANLIVFVKATDVGMTGSELPDEINSNAAMIQTLSEVRGKGSHIVGRCSDWRLVDEQSPMMPMVVTVAPAASAEAHLSARLILDNRCHDSMAGTGSVCVAACSRIQGSIANQQLRPDSASEHVLQLEHPRGVMPVSVVADAGPGHSALPVFKSLSFIRTARAIMAGELYVPPEVQFTPQPAKDARNGHANGDRPVAEVTKELCKFVVDFKYEMLPERMVSKIKELVLDQIGVAAGASRDADSSEPFTKAVMALQQVTLQGGSTVFARGQGFLPQFAGLLNAAFVHTFDFDDTNADAILHPGASVVPAVLVQGQLSNTDGKDLITAFAVGYEIACRLGRLLGLGSYERGFHNTGTVGIFGAIAGIAKIRGFGQKQVEDAFGLAGSFASGSMQFLENGSWNKRLHPAMAVHNAFVAVSMAEQGVLGSSKVIEGKFGLLHSYSTSTSLDGVTDALGSEWVTESTAIKPFPACRMTHTAIEMATEISCASKGRAVKHIKVELSPGCWNIVGVPSANKIHPECIVDAQFSIYYQIAACWLYGSDLQWRVYEKLKDKEINELTEKIEVVENDKMVTLEASIRIDWQDGGASVERHMVHPLGETKNPLTKERIHGKFLGLVSHIYGAKNSRRIIEAVESMENTTGRELMGLL